LRISCVYALLIEIVIKTYKQHWRRLLLRQLLPCLKPRGTCKRTSLGRPSRPTSWPPAWSSCTWLTSPDQPVHPRRSRPWSRRCTRSRLWWRARLCIPEVPDSTLPWTDPLALLEKLAKRTGTGRPRGRHRGWDFRWGRRMTYYWSTFLNLKTNKFKDKLHIWLWWIWASLVRVLRHSINQYKIMSILLCFNIIVFDMVTSYFWIKI